MSSGFFFHMAREKGPEIARLNLRSGGDVSIGAFWEINSAFYFAGINRTRGVTSDEESLKTYSLLFIIHVLHHCTGVNC
jgi:hypothetical protein